METATIQIFPEPSQSDWFVNDPKAVSLDDASFEHAAAFEDVTIHAHSQRFRGATLKATASGVRLDLRRATLDPEGASINVESALSGLEILVPCTWHVACEVDGVCAEVVTPHLRLASDSPRARLRVYGRVVAGALYVR